MKISEDSIFKTLFQIEKSKEKIIFEIKIPNPLKSSKTKDLSLIQ